MTALAQRHHLTADPRLTKFIGHGEKPIRHLELVWSKPEPKKASGVVLLRRRTAALVLVLLVGVGVWTAASAGLSWFADRTGASNPVPISATQPVATQWRVQGGDTLWGIARAVKPTGDVRPLVQKMSAERHSRALNVGEVIQVPAS